MAGSPKLAIFAVAIWLSILIMKSTIQEPVKHVSTLRDTACMHIGTCTLFSIYSGDIMQHTYSYSDAQNLCNCKDAVIESTIICYCWKLKGLIV